MTDLATLSPNETNQFKIVSVIRQIAERVARGALPDLNIDGASALTSPAVGDELAIYDASAATNFKITLANLFTLATAYKVGTFTRDISTATGAQAITGIGFTPKAIAFLSGAAAGIALSSIGFSDNTTEVAWSTLTGTGSGFLSATTCISVGTTGADNQTATITSFDADGFTLAWIKNGTPTGTATMAYLAFR